MKSRRPNPRGWNHGKRRSLAHIASYQTAQPKWQPGPVIPIKTLCATKGTLHCTATWNRIQDCWQLISYPTALNFLQDCDDYLEAGPLLEANGWTARWHDSSMSPPVPIATKPSKPATKRPKAATQLPLTAARRRKPFEPAAKYIESPTKILAAHNEFLSGQATFERINGLWTCTQADDSLRFILKLDPIAAKMDLIKRGFSWQWERQPAGHGKNPRSTGAETPGNAPGQTPCNKLEARNPQWVTKPIPRFDSGTASDTAYSVAPSGRSVNRAGGVQNSPIENKPTMPGATLFGPFTSHPLSLPRGIDSQTPNADDTSLPGRTIPDACSSGVERDRLSEASTLPTAR